MSESTPRITLRHRDLADRVRVLALGGELDYHSLPQLREATAQHMLDRPSNYVIDLSGLRFLDSTGLGFLLGLAKRVVSEGGQLVLMSPPPQIEKLLRTTGLTHLMTVTYGEEEALNKLRAMPPLPSCKPPGTLHRTIR